MLRYLDIHAIVKNAGNNIEEKDIEHIANDVWNCVYDLQVESDKEKRDLILRLVRAESRDIKNGICNVCGATYSFHGTIIFPIHDENCIYYPLNGTRKNEE
jgi:hypothetical protein